MRATRPPATGRPVADADLRRYAPPVAPVADVGLVAAPLEYSVKAGRLLRLVGWLTIALGVLFIGVMFLASQNRAIPSWIAVTAIPLVIGVIYLVVGAAVKKGKLWARVVACVLSVLMLLSFPIGTLIGGFALYYLIKGWSEGGAGAGAPV